MTNQTQSIQELNQELKQRFNDEIRTPLGAFEPERKKTIEKICKICFIGIVFLTLSVLLFVSFFVLNIPEFPGILFTFAGFFGIPISISLTGVFCVKAKRKYEKNMKRNVMPVFLKSLGENWKWTSNNLQTSFKELTSSGLIDYFSDYDMSAPINYFLDSFAGDYKNAPVNITEAMLRVNSKNGGYSVFDGLVTTFKVSNHYEGHTVFYKRGLRTFFRMNTEVLKQLKEVKEIPNSKFKRSYVVRTNNISEAKTILTDEFMEQCFKLKEFFKAYAVNFSFKDDLVLMTISHFRDCFAIPSIFKPIYDTKVWYRTIDELTAILSTVDALKLNKGNE